MTSLNVTIAIWIAVLASGLFGLLLAKLLPIEHTSDRSRDILGGVIGLVGLLLALVLGLMIWTGYGVTQTQKTELQLLCARALEFDLELKQYGPDADNARQMLRTELVWAHEQFWGEGQAQSDAFRVTYKNMASMSEVLTGLKPQTDRQRQLLGAAGLHYSQIGETRLLMTLQLSDPVSWPLLWMVVSWCCMLFMGYGVLSRANATTIVALVLGAGAIASAIFLILSLSQPYTSAFKLNPELLEQTILDVGQ
jgi:hypothetical protein